MNKTINEEAIRFTYRLLNHGDMASRVHCQGKDGALDSRLVKGVEEVVTWAKHWNGKGQCYISRNPMIEWQKPGRFTCLSIDVDPLYDKATGANLLQVSRAVKTGQRILQRYPGGYLATSGNGILLLYPIPATISSSLNGSLAGAYKRFYEELKSEFEPGSECNVDVLADDARLIRLIGTRNVKGVTENHRLSKYLSIPKPSEAHAPQVFARLQALTTEPRRDVTVAKVPAYEPWVMTALDGLPAGQKHVTIIKLAGYFGAKHIPIELAKRLILEANAHAQDVPAAETDVVARIEDVYGRIKAGRYHAEDHVASVVAEERVFEVAAVGAESRRYLDDLAERSQFRTPEIPWPFEDLNRMTWGLPRGALTILGAWTGKGKTSIAITVAEYLTRIGKSVLYFPTEMSQKEIKDRYISVATGIWNVHLFNGQVMHNPAEKKLLDAFMPEFDKRPFYMPKTDSPRLTPHELRRALDACNPDFLVVDFLQRLGARASDRRREVGEFIMTVKDEIQKRKIGCLVLSQFHRPQRAQNGKYFPPTVFDFAECGDIENTSDISIILHPPLDEKGYVVEASDGERVKPVLCNVAKNRHGGTTGTTYLTIDTLTTRFSPV
jgi:replicative DNA helicase